MEEPILLGVCDEKVKNDQETSWVTNKIGGKPNWIHNTDVPHCKLCGANSLRQVCQIYCPVGQSDYHRTLYLFACVNKPCWNKNESWIAARYQILDTGSHLHPGQCASNNSITIEESYLKDRGNCSQEQSMSCAEAAFDDWGVDVDDWGDTECTDNEDGQNDLISMLTDKTLTAELVDEKYKAKLPFVEIENISTLSVDKNAPLDQNMSEVERMASQISIDDTENEQDFAVYKHLNGSSISPVVEQNSNMDMQKSGLNTYLKTTKESECKVTGIPIATKCQDFTSYYMNVFEESKEPFEDDANLKHEKRLLREYLKAERVDLAALVDDSSGGAGESYEKSAVKHGDNTFHKFKKRLTQYPQQVLRYQFNGKPLFIKKPQDFTVPPCQRCGALRHFELQLMPAMVSVLKGHEDSGDLEDCWLEFGTVLVYTCSQSCWQEGNTAFREEYIIVQSDPDQHLFKT